MTGALTPLVLDDEAADEDEPEAGSRSRGSMRLSSKRAKDRDGALLVEEGIVDREILPEKDGPAPAAEPVGIDRWLNEPLKRPE